jgi:hypothetical protein
VRTASIIRAMTALAMEAVHASETSVNFNVNTRRYIPEDSKLHTRRRENLKSQRTVVIYLLSRILKIYEVVLGDVMISVLAIGPKTRNFRPGRERWVIWGDKNPHHAFLRKGSKAFGSMKKDISKAKFIIFFAKFLLL